MTITLARAGRAPMRAPLGAAASRPITDLTPLVAEDALDSTWAIVQEQRFAALHSALLRHGGCLPADALCALLRAHWNQPLSRVARWIVHREVVALPWRGQVWLPLFQFERPSLDPVPAASEAVRMLRDVYDDWELTEWFVRPNDLLAGDRPATRLSCDPCAVLEAARMDRFINRW